MTSVNDGPVEVHPVHVRNTEYQVRVDNQGRFMATVGPETLYSNTKDGLRDKILELTAKASVKVSVPFTLMTPGGLRDRGPARGEVTGIHGGNGNLMVHWLTGWQAGAKAQWTPNYGDVIFADVTDEEAEQWRKLRKASTDAQNELGEFERKHKIDLKVLAVNAVTEAVNSANAG